MSISPCPRSAVGDKGMNVRDEATECNQTNVNVDVDDTMTMMHPSRWRIDCCLYRCCHHCLASSYPFLWIEVLSQKIFLCYLRAVQCTRTRVVHKKYLFWAVLKVATDVR